MRNPEDRECGRGVDTSQPWKGGPSPVRRTPYLEAGVRLEVADAGSITRKVKGFLRKSTLAGPANNRAMQRGGFIAGGALTEPGTRVESHPICLWAEGSDSIRRPIGLVQGSSHNTILSLCGRLGLGNCLQQRSRHYTGLMLFSEGGILRE